VYLIHKLSCRHYLIIGKLFKSSSSEHYFWIVEVSHLHGKEIGIQRYQIYAVQCKVFRAGWHDEKERMMLEYSRDELKR